MKWASLLLLSLMPLQAPAATLSRVDSQRPAPVSASAVRNADLAASAVDGRVLAPGEEFSFNRALDEVRPRFVYGTSYLYGRVIQSKGGGICQVSSVLYDAVLLAGLPVLERYNHSVHDPAEAYVKPGLDAAVSNSSGADFRFKNDTAQPLTITVSSGGGRVWVSLLGQGPVRKRWLETQVLERRPFASKVRVDAKLKPGKRRLLRKGFDGLRVSRSLCWADAEGNSRCAALGVDEYLKVDRLEAVAPEVAP